MGQRRGPAGGRVFHCHLQPLLQAPWPWVCAPSLLYREVKEDTVDDIQSHTPNLRIKPKTLSRLVSTCSTHLVVLKLFDPFGSSLRTVTKFTGQHRDGEGSRTGDLSLPNFLKAPELKSELLGALWAHGGRAGAPSLRIQHLSQQFSEEASGFAGGARRGEGAPAELAKAPRAGPSPSPGAGLAPPRLQIADLGL